MQSFIRSLVVAVMIAASHAHAHAAWPQPKGGGFFKLDYYSIFARRFYSDDGKIYDINGAGTLLSAHTVSLYGEYGLTKRLTAIAYVPFLMRLTVNEGIGSITGAVLQPGLGNTSFGDVDLGLKYNFLNKGRFVMSAAILAGLPTGDDDDPNLLFTGDGEFNQFSRVDWGYGANRWYATGYIGFNHRTKDYSEEFRYFAEAGYWLKPGAWLVQGKFYGIESFDNGTPDNTGNGLFSNNVEFASPQLGIAYEHRAKWGISALGAAAMKGRNVLASPSISVGFYVKV